MSMEYDPILYDSDPRPFIKDEVAFYVKLVEKFRPKTILELGVGTGRIFSKLLPLVRSGVGIDISEAMLDRCRKVCAENHNYELYKLSFVDFDLQTTFDLIYLPFNTFQHLLTEEDQAACLKNIKNHMYDKSHFILDLMNGDNLSFDLEQWKQDYSTILPSGGILRRDQKTVGVDKVTSVVHKKFRYTETVKGVMDKVQEFDALMKINPNKKIHEILEKLGFEIEDIWFDYLFGHDTDAKKMIYCLKTHEI